MHSVSTLNLQQLIFLSTWTHPSNHYLYHVSLTGLRACWSRSQLALAERRGRQSVTDRQPLTLTFTPTGDSASHCTTVPPSYEYNTDILSPSKLIWQTSIQQLWSNLSIHLESYFWPPNECDDESPIFTLLLALFWSPPTSERNIWLFSC